MALRKAELKELATNDRAFDAAVLRGTLGIYNGLHSDFRPSSVNLGQLVEGAFDWLPAVLRERAGRAGVPASTVKWSGDEGVDEMIEAGQVLLYTIGAFGEPSKRLRFSTAPAREGKPRLSPEQWVNKILAALPIYSRYTFEKDAFSLASVPLLTSVQRCVAYSLVLVWTDRHDFADLVRPCGYLVEDSPNSLAHHYFLADDARQRFCTPAHSNAQRQREWRRNQKEGAK